MPSPVGFFGLRTPLDLLAKMEVHCEQLIADPLNEYAAFDFCVAVTHFPEWLGHFRCSQEIKGAKAKAMHAVCCTPFAAGIDLAYEFN